MPPSWGASPHNRPRRRGRPRPRLLTDFTQTTPPFAVLCHGVPRSRARTTTKDENDEWVAFFGRSILKPRENIDIWCLGRGKAGRFTYISKVGKPSRFTLSSWRSVQPFVRFVAPSAPPSLGAFPHNRPLECALVPEGTIEIRV